MENLAKPILPGCVVRVSDDNSIYKGYKGFVQRVTTKKAAVLFEGGNWDKLVTFALSDLDLV
tara:strand:+ start:2786 stop:2971 length:186 start_codon:yes stop_codon:yes gene_type:complete